MRNLRIDANIGIMTETGTKTAAPATLVCSAARHARNTTKQYVFEPIQPRPTRQKYLFLEKEKAHLARTPSSLFGKKSQPRRPHTKHTHTHTRLLQCRRFSSSHHHRHCARRRSDCPAARRQRIQRLRTKYQAPLAEDCRHRRRPPWPATKFRPRPGATSRPGCYRSRPTGRRAGSSCCRHALRAKLPAVSGSGKCFEAERTVFKPRLHIVGPPFSGGRRHRCAPQHTSGSRGTSP